MGYFGQVNRPLKLSAASSGESSPDRNFIIFYTASIPIPLQGGTGNALACRFTMRLSHCFFFDNHYNGFKSPFYPDSGFYSKWHGRRRRFFLGALKKVSEIFLKTDFAQKAIEGEADLSLFTKRPNLRITFGLFLIAVSYIIGWPAVGVLGTISIYLREPLLIAIGGPIVYGFSHLVFLCGMYFAGSQYASAFSRWLTRIVIKKLNAEKK